MAKGGSGAGLAAGASAATFRLAEGASLVLPDGCAVTVRQGALQLPDGQRLPLPESGGSVTIERRVQRPDGRTALVRHTIRLGEPADQTSADAPTEIQAAPSGGATDRRPAQVGDSAPVDGPVASPVEEPSEVPTELRADEPASAPVEVPVVSRTEEPSEVPTELRADEPASAPVEVPVVSRTEEPSEVPTELRADEPASAPVEVPVVSPAEEPSEVPTEEPAEVVTESVNEIPAEVQTAPTTEASVLAPADLPAKFPSVVPTEAPAEVQAAVPTKVPAEVMTEAPARAPAEISAEVLTEVSSEEPVKTSAEKSARVPAEVSSEVPAQTSASEPGPTEVNTPELLDEAPSVAPAEVPVDVPLGLLAAATESSAPPNAAEETLPVAKEDTHPEPKPAGNQPSDGELETSRPRAISQDGVCTSDSAAAGSNSPASSTDALPTPASALDGSGSAAPAPGDVPTPTTGPKGTLSLTSAPDDIVTSSTAQREAASTASTPGDKTLMASAPKDSTLIIPTAEDTTPVIPTAGDTTTVTPAAEDTTPLTPTAEDTTPVTPAAEDTTALTPTAEDTTPITPTSKDTTSITPTAEDTTTITPASEDTTKIASAHEDTIPTTSAAKDGPTATTELKGTTQAPSPAEYTIPITSVPEITKPSAKNETYALTSKPYCEWTETHAESDHAEQGLQAGRTESESTQDRAIQPQRDAAAVAANARRPDQLYEGNDKGGSVKGDSPEKEETESVSGIGLAHHDSLRLPISVPRLQKQDDGYDGNVDSDRAEKRRAFSSQKRREEDDAMRLKLNSILHRLGYGAPSDSSDATTGTDAKTPGVLQQPGSNAGAQDSPEQPEPVSVTKVISYFESITPQRVESPGERKKILRADARSPPALRSSSGAKSPEAVRAAREAQARGREASPTPRKVNFAESATRVYISNSEPDEMEDIPIPRPDEPSPPSPKDPQICPKDVRPVITKQPVRLATVLAQNPPPAADEHTVIAEPADGVSEVLESSNESSQGQKATHHNSDTRAPVSAATECLDEPQNVEASESVSEPDTHHSAVHAKISSELQSLEASEASTDSPDAMATVAQSHLQEETKPLQPLDSPAVSTTVTASTDSGVSEPSPAADGNSAPAGALIQAEPLPRPSSVAMLGDAPLDGSPASPAVDPTERPDGQPGHLLAASEMLEGDIAAGPGDPFLAGAPGRQRPVADKSTSWFEECMVICCCCWAP